MSWNVSLWVYPVCTSLGFLDLGGYFLSHFRKFFTVISSNIFLYIFIFYSSWTPIFQMFMWLLLSQRSLRLLSYFFSFFFLYSAMLQLFPLFYLPVSLIHSSASVILLFVPFIMFFYFHYHVVHCWLFFISSRYLNISCIFSICVSILFFCAPILFLRFWISFTILTLNSFSGKLPNSSLFVWSCVCVCVCVCV